MPRAGVTAERLTRAAADMADRTGLDSVTATALARHFGVTAASLYSHVKGIDDLRARLAALALDELADRVAAALAGRAGKDALTAFANAYRDYAKAHPGRYAAAQIRLAPHTATPDVVTAGRRHTELTRAILRGYGVPDDEQTPAVRLLASTFHGYVTLEAAGGFAHTGDVDTSWSRVLDALDTALTHWPAPTPPSRPDPPTTP
ncbi:TetR/AcrR family transcriptional regulator [Actinomadura sp. WMMB 499]|uniref:TetR/AcrR family transcriptional regulator n=1 Tax=Actinomadura sp. WMMB 499 TaxID=1219491 RepID=UPI001246CABC|nr:TetR-like C-terminal domain-containing protein [Actinomadura sp. WMMB 499]QFG19848.1 WHG domain-containing protein [Actinomadura sp. WMMB 499]